MMGLAWLDIGFWDLWKAVSVALTGMFGIMGLLTNYKEKDTGRITVWGRVNMAGIILSATMGVLSQLIEAQNKTASAQRSAYEANKSAKVAVQTSVQAQAAATQAKAAAINTTRLIGDLLSVSRRTAAIARGTERSVVNSRSAANAGREAASRTLVVARGTAEAVGASKAGLVRIERLLSPFENLTLILVAQPNTWLDNPCPESQTASIWLSISNSNKKEQEQSAEYEGQGSWKFSHSSGINSCEMAIPLKATQNSGVFSYLDLPSKILNISLELNTSVYTIVYGRITTNNGQQIIIPLESATINNGGGYEGNPPLWLMSYTFPSGIDPRSVKF